MTSRGNSPARFAVGICVCCLFAAQRTDADVTAPPLTTPQPGLELAAASALRLHGDSTLHRYSIDAHGMSATFVLGPATVKTQGQGSGVESLVRQGEIRSIELLIPVEQLSSGDESLDKKLHELLLSNGQKSIVFRSSSYEMSEPTPPGSPFGVELRGKLSINGVEREIELPVLCAADGEDLRIQGAKALDISNYGMQPPEFLFGLVKTQDLIRIDFNLLVQMKK